MAVVRPPRCQGCVFRTPTVAYSGRIDAPIVIVGESPGAMEVVKGKPFVGDSGQLLKKAFPEGIDENDIMYTNAIQCLPHKEKDAKILAQACRACQNRLLEEVASHPREVILAVGNAAVWSLTSDYALKITQIHGRVFDSPLARHGIVAAYHPAFVLRGGGTYKVFRDDVQYAFRLLKGEKKEAPIYKPYICTEEDLPKILNLLETSDEVAADIETTGLNPRMDDILCLGLCFGDTADGRVAYVIPGELLGHFKAIWDNPKIKWIWHNGKFDSAFLNEDGYNARVDEDTMLLSYCLNEAGGIHGLEDVAQSLLGAPDYKHMLKPYLKNKKDSYAKIPKPVLYEYLALDCGHTLESWRILRVRVRNDDKLEKLYVRVLIPASNMLQTIERRGFFVDSNRLEENDSFYQSEIERQYERVNEFPRSMEGIPDINPNSPKQVAWFLYDVLELKTKHGNKDTDKDTLLSIVPEHPVVVALLAYRKAAKARGTYVKGIRKAIEPDGCVHSTYKLHATRTGRLSSAAPNVQNIPRDPRLRGTFIAREGHVLLDFDLDQAELRSLAALSGDPTFCSIYESDGLSLHREVSEWLWTGNPKGTWKERYSIGDKEGGDKTDPTFMEAYDEYMRTKALNFGIVYGREEFSIAEEFGVPIYIAREWINKWFYRFPIAKQFIDACRAAPSKGRTLFTPFGRKKRFGAVSAARIKAMQNEAANFPHQSVASDITLVTAIKVHKRIQDHGAYIVNLVHDSIVVECPDNPDSISSVANIILPEMVQTPIEWGITRIPFKSDCKVGQRWGMGDKLKLKKYTKGDDPCSIHSGD